MEKDILEKIEIGKAALESALAEVQALDESSTAEETRKKLQECSNFISEAKEVIHPLIGLD